MISVIIPARNESENITETVKEIQNSISSTEFKEDFEIIVVDDHSEDSTFKTVSEIGNERIKCIRLSRRGGSHTAIRAGLSFAKGDCALCISADGQDDPSALPAMLEKRRNGAGIVWALRKDRKNESRVYRFSAASYYFLLKYFGGIKDRQIDPSRADFFLLDRNVIDALNSCPEQYTSIFDLLNWMGFSNDIVEYERRKRRAGKSQWGFYGCVYMAVLRIVSFSGLPLKLMTITGFIVSLLGLLYAVFLIFNAIFGNPMHGWSSLMVAIVFLGGVQMMMMGVIGEYLWRNLEESRRRPVFFIEKMSHKLKTGEWNRE